MLPNDKNRNGVTGKKVFKDFLQRAFLLYFMNVFENCQAAAREQATWKSIQLVTRLVSLRIFKWRKDEWNEKNSFV